MKKDINEKSYYGGETEFKQILVDLANEPHIVCEYNKRRVCDSYYIKKYNTLLEQYEKLLKHYSDVKEELENYKQLLAIYKELSIDITNEISGKVVK